MELPILCTLNEADLKKRRRMILDFVRGTAISLQPVPLGYAYTFNASSEVLAQLTKLVDLERECCQFLTFKIIVEAGGAPIRLEVTGPPEANAIIKDFVVGTFGDAAT